MPGGDGAVEAIPDDVEQLDRERAGYVVEDDDGQDSDVDGTDIPAYAGRKFKSSKTHEEDRLTLKRQKRWMLMNMWITWRK